jgi:predicted enzyme related to lactoylglutathione lyase
MNPVVHFEMPAEDRKRMADFYTKVFGWKTEQLGEDMGNYVLVTTTLQVQVTWFQMLQLYRVLTHKLHGDDFSKAP